MKPTSLQVLITASLLCVAGPLVTEASFADAHPGRYVVKPGIVYDTKTKLTWQQDTAPTPYTLDDANKYCHALTLGSLDWRLPSLKELETLVDESRVNPAIDPAVFPNTPGKYFWSATKVTTFEQSAWTVDFYRGVDNFFETTMSQLVRCVH